MIFFALSSVQEPPTNILVMEPTLIYESLALPSMEPHPQNHKEHRAFPKVSLGIVIVVGAQPLQKGVLVSAPLSALPLTKEVMYYRPLMGTSPEVAEVAASSSSTLEAIFVSPAPPPHHASLRLEAQEVTSCPAKMQRASPSSLSSPSNLVTPFPTSPTRVSPMAGEKSRESRMEAIMAVDHHVRKGKKMSTSLLAPSQP